MKYCGEFAITPNSQYSDYNLYSNSPGHSTGYVKHTEDNHVLHLTVFDDEQTCKLMSVYKGITLTTDVMQFPHPKFYIFEAQMLRLLRGVE